MTWQWKPATTAISFIILLLGSVICTMQAVKFHFVADLTGTEN